MLAVRVGSGLAVVAAATAVGQLVGWLVPAASPLVVGVLLGIVWRAVFGPIAALTPGFRFAASWLLRAGVMLLGLQLVVSQMVHFGLPVLAVVLVSVLGAFVATRWFGRLLGLSKARSLLVATGVSICGASAVAAVNQVAGGDEEDVATAVTSVTLLGTLAIGVYPLVGLVLGLPDHVFGIWTGASVHEVGQVVAIGAAAGPAVLQVAVVIKLARVALLAPLVTAVGLSRRGTGDARPPLLPWFVVGFVLLALVRTTLPVPAAVLSTAEQLASVLLCAGMFGLGSAVDLRSVVRAGGPAIAAGGLGSVVLACLAGAGIWLTA
ncbi:YeiH family protein [Actinophytocola sediminis]